MSKTDTSVSIIWVIYQTAGGKYLKWLETQFSSSDVSSITCVCVLWATLQEQPRHIHFNEGRRQLRCFCCAKVFVEVAHHSVATVLQHNINVLTSRSQSCEVSWSKKKRKEKNVFGAGEKKLSYLYLWATSVSSYKTKYQWCRFSPHE